VRAAPLSAPAVHEAQECVEPARPEGRALPPLLIDRLAGLRLRCEPAAPARRAIPQAAAWVWREAHMTLIQKTRGATTR